MARYRMRSEFEINRLGMAWVVLRPLINAAIYGLIFGLLQGNNRPQNFHVFVVIGVFFFEFFQGCFNDGSKAITSNRSLVQSLAFPRMTLPLAAVVERFLQFLVMLGVLIPILAVFGFYPRWDWLLVVPLVILFTLFSTGVALITARLTDVRIAGPAPWKPLAGISGPLALPIEFTARTSANLGFPRAT